MVSRQAAAVLKGVGCEQWICNSEEEMVERALFLASDYKYLQQLRLEQRKQVAHSELLDHAGLAVTLEKTFRSWWLRWLQQQGWPTDGKQQAWRQRCTAEDRAPLTPITNSICRRITLWLGSLPDSVRKDRETRGQRVVELRNLQPWGEPVSLFDREKPNQVFAWIEGGASEESQRWWQHTYPQLIWETEGPLAQR